MAKREGGAYETVNRNRFVALMSCIAQSGSAPGSKMTVVADSVISSGLEEFVESIGANIVRYKKGYMNVINEARRLKASGLNAALAIETSGHSAFADNGWLDDGTYSAVLACCEVKRRKVAGEGGIMAMIAQMRESGFEEELRMNLCDPKGSATSLFPDVESLVSGGSMGRWRLDPDNQEGARFFLEGGGWFMVRPSLHDPVISSQWECQDLATARKAVKAVRDVIREEGFGEKLDLSELDKVADGE